MCVIVTKYLTVHLQGDGVYLGLWSRGVSPSQRGRHDDDAVTLYMAAEQVAADSHMTVERAQILRLGIKWKVFWPTPIN